MMVDAHRSFHEVELPIRMHFKNRISLCVLIEICIEESTVEEYVCGARSISGTSDSSLSNSFKDPVLTRSL